MPASTTDPDDRLPTTGPERTPYDQFQFTATDGDRGLLYHVEDHEQWIETDLLVSLEDWR